MATDEQLDASVRRVLLGILEDGGDYNAIPLLNPDTSLFSPAVVDALRAPLESAVIELDADVAQLQPAVSSLETLVEDGRLSEPNLAGTIDAVATETVDQVAAPLQLLTYADFTGRANGAINGVTQDFGGDTWVGTGTQPPTVVSGGLVSTGTGYAWAESADPIDRISMDVEWRGTEGASANNVVMAVAPVKNSIADLIHITVSPNSIRVDFLTGSGNWSTARQVPMTLAFRRLVPVGVPVTVTAYIADGGVTVVGPHGESASFSDARVSAKRGGAYFVEPLGGLAKYPAVLAIRTEKARNTAALALGGGSAAFDSNGAMLGNPFSVWQAGIGRDPASGLPALTLGPAVVQTYLTADAAIGATSISTAEPVDRGRYLTTPGDNLMVFSPDEAGEEIVTASGNPSGSGPYTQAVVALTKAHPAGTPVWMKSNKSVVLSYNAANGFTKVPGNSYIDGTLYLGSNLDTYITRVSAGIIGTAPLQLYRQGYGTTANRPTAAAATRCIYLDTTLGFPVYSDGTNWRKFSDNTTV